MADQWLEIRHVADLILSLDQDLRDQAIHSNLEYEYARVLFDQATQANDQAVVNGFLARGRIKFACVPERQWRGAGVADNFPITNFLGDPVVAPDVPGAAPAGWDHTIQHLFVEEYQRILGESNGEDVLELQSELLTRLFRRDRANCDVWSDENADDTTNEHHVSIEDKLQPEYHSQRLKYLVKLPQHSNPPSAGRSGRIYKTT
ncbi:hypothetical protein LTR84_012882 [Exophiala bonariae]|uniref:Uncharacterized protein n=1 Tax=Exophiala bonariae TaxID=1690606 RepID=A0AAV9NE79_9EURO|nr:hypothetical protein LTR84_012882 [Exophiala bonariae]